MRTKSSREPDSFLKYMARFADGVRRAFPYCPFAEEHVIAQGSCTRGIGRISAEPEAIQRAVAAFVRHRYTTYQARLDTHGDRDQARAEVRDAMAAVLEQWRRGRKSLAA